MVANLDATVKTLLAAPISFRQYIVAQFHATGIGAEQKPFPITDLAEAAQSIGWQLCGVERLENDDMTIFVVAQKFLIF